MLPPRTTSRAHHPRRRARHDFTTAVDRFLRCRSAVIALVWANTAPETVLRLRAVAGVSGQRDRHGALLRAHHAGDRRSRDARRRAAFLAPMERCRSSPRPAASRGAPGVYLAVGPRPLRADPHAGWPIACAIDIAAAYYVLKSILPRSGVLPFVLLLAIATDLLRRCSLSRRRIRGRRGRRWRGAAAPRARPRRRDAGAEGARFWPYLRLSATLSWLAFYREGLHPAFALVPIVPFLPHEPRRLDLLADPPDDDAVHHFEHEWNTLVQVSCSCSGS